MTMTAESEGGVVFDIQHFSVHDGPGIRTNVFLKGCPLRCRWCSNPESQSPRPQITYEERLCIGCGECARRCDRGAIDFARGIAAVELSRCLECENRPCLKGCYARAIKLAGERMAAEQVIGQVLRDQSFYRKGDGGVTFTGGEPFAQPAFLLGLLETAKRHGLNTAVETCLAVPWAAIEPCVPLLDTFLTDIKHVDDALLREWTGADGGLIRDNFRRLAGAGAALIARVPVVAGFNESDGAMAAIADFALSLGIQTMHLLPYHGLGTAKYARLNREYAMRDAKPPARERMAALVELVRGKGLHAVLNG